MSEINEFMDPFEDLDINEFKIDKQQVRKNNIEQNEVTLASLNNHKRQIEVIKKVAEDLSFSSRENERNKGAQTATKTFSFYKEEIDIINQYISEYYRDPSLYSTAPSGSDIVRAALHVLANKPLNEVMELLELYRGRGRK
jgi:hypothetical protein